MAKVADTRAHIAHDDVICYEALPPNLNFANIFMLGLGPNHQN